MISPEARQAANIALKLADSVLEKYTTDYGTMPSELALQLGQVYATIAVALK
jgi:cobalamin biosynthesis Mg chelatase CobN